MASTQHLSLESIHAAGRQLVVRYCFNKYRFCTSYWYDFDLQSLETTYGLPFMEKVYFHCAAFGISKLCSLKPSVLDWGPYARWHTAEFEHVWRTVLNNVSAQWRYENDLAHYQGPAFASEPALAKSNPVDIHCTGEGSTTLAFFGGGKDSLVMLELLSKMGIPFSSLTYSHSIYGRADIQHRINDSVLSVLSPNCKAIHHQLCIIEDFLDSPVLDDLGKQLGIKTVFVAETPSSLFAALPILLYYRYTDIAMAHEHSANVGNLVWDSTGEEVNHQWEKSMEAELLLHGYLQKALIRNASYFSVLQPIHDVVIFHIAGTRPDAIVHTHSCNLKLPWCLRCPKCCYVWLCFMAYLPCNLVDSMFQGVNLLDVADNGIHFREMIGLGTKKPFECIGEIEEAKLAFELCRRKGIRGCAMEVFEEKVSPTLNPTVVTAFVDKYTTVHSMESFHIPEKFRDSLLPLLEQAGENARKKLKAVLLQQ